MLCRHEIRLKPLLTGLGATTSKVGPRGRRLGWDSCFHTVVSFTAPPDLVVSVITDGAKDGGGSSKAVLTAVAPSAGDSGWLGYPIDCPLDDGYEARTQPGVGLPDGRHDDVIDGDVYVDK